MIPAQPRPIILGTEPIGLSEYLELGVARQAVEIRRRQLARRQEQLDQQVASGCWHRKAGWTRLLNHSDRCIAGLPCSGAPRRTGDGEQGSPQYKSADWTHGTLAWVGGFGETS